MAIITWDVRRTPRGWCGWMRVRMDAHRAYRAEVHDAPSPGDAMDVMTDDVVGAMGIVDVPGIVATTARTVADVVDVARGRIRRGRPPMTPATHRMPGGLARVARVASMRPGGIAYPGAKHVRWDAWGRPIVARTVVRPEGWP